MLNTDRFEEFISQYPIYEYRLVDTAEIEVRERVRIICKQECERYGTTWACPPAGEEYMQSIQDVYDMQ